MSGIFRSGTGEATRNFCCAGCLAISEIIHHGGLERYYALRDAPGNRPDSINRDEYQVYDNPRLQADWLMREGDSVQAEFLIEGIACAACVWLIENRLTQLPAVESAHVNFSTHRLDVTWKASHLKVSELMMTVQQVGYRIRLYTRDSRRAQQDLQRRNLLKRLGVSGAFGMQIMVISVALYAGDWFGIDPELKGYLERINLLLTLPILLYSAQPFFVGAWRGLCNRSPGMDLPVSLGMGLAFAGSLWSTVTARGEVYYDSIAMFAFFLLGARYLELATRLKGARALDALASVIPNSARRWRSDQSLETVPAVETEPGEKLLVRAGEVVPTDGVITEGHSQFDESFITGEDRPVPRVAGDPVMAGSMNMSQPVTITITAASGATVLDSILRLAERSHAEKPWISQLAEQVAKWFVSGVILLAISIAALGLWMGKPDWLSTTIAVLVVTCPCALSLATPLALNAATGNLLHRGVHVIRGHALETLRRTDHVVFDKTGTLTRGEMALTEVTTVSGMQTTEAVRIAAALEQSATHPLAGPLLDAAGHSPLPPVKNFRSEPGRGVHGTVLGKDYRLGSVSFVTGDEEQNPIAEKTDDREEFTSTLIMLGDLSGPLATFRFRDEIRPGAQTLVQRLATEGVGVSLLSGDRPGTVASLARDLGINDAQGGCLPEQKLAALNTLIENGRVVAMVGDGINDAPSLSRAHLGVAVARNINLAAANADLVISAENLGALEDARRISLQTFRIIRQNITWALTYNILAVPAAIAGLVPPWLAGIGMSLSSVVVVMNASRLTRI